jgi:hypothetical protein
MLFLRKDHAIYIRYRSKRVQKVRIKGIKEGKGIKH